jgi:outer membrane cobalamin receptor
MSYKLIVPAVASLAAATTSFAQADPQSAAASATTSPVEISAYRVPTILTETSQGVTVITQEEIRDRNPDSMPQLLNQIPGVQVDQAGGPGGISSMYIRGSDPNHTLVIVDGIRLNDPTTSRGGSVDLSSLSVSNIERIEVIRGGGSAIYGADAIGGVLNIVTKRGRTDGVHGELSGGIGTRDYAAGNGSVYGGSEQVQFQAGISSVRDGRVEDGGTLALSTLSGSLTVPLTSNAEFHLTAYGTDRSSSGFPDDSGGIRLAVLRTLDQKNSQQAALGGGLSWRVAQGIKLDANLTTYNTFEDIVSPGVAPGVRSPVFGVPANASHTDFTRSTGLFSATVDLPYQTVATLGYERIEELGTNQTVIPSFFTTSSFDLLRNTDSGFAELKSSPLNGLILRAGVRYDDVHQVARQTSPSVGARYRLADIGTTLKANYAEGFKPPSFFALGLSPILGGNPNLVPETNANTEVGFEQPLLSDRALVAASWFRNRYKNLVDFDTTLNQLVNRTPISAEGVEGEARWSPLRGLTLGVQVTYAHTRIDATGERVKGRPDWRGGFTIGYAPTERIWLSWQTIYVDTVLDSSVPTGDVLLPSFWRTDISASYQINKLLRVTAAIDNLFDKGYEQFVGFTNPGIRGRLAVSANF